MNWGIVGYGEIAPSFIDGLGAVEGQKLLGIASVSKNQFLSENNIYPGVIIYSSYNELFENPEIDIVYICTTNNLHKGNVLNALKYGKNVLCEKPIAICQNDLSMLVAEAKAKGLFLMEGMWTRFLPAYRHFKYLLDSNAIGKVNYANIDFGFFSDWDDSRRLKNPDLFGGVVLDNLDYCVFLAQDVFKIKPISIISASRKYTTGVEDMCAVILQYQDDSFAEIFASFQQKTNQDALIYGEKGYIHLKSFWNGTLVELHNAEGVQKWDFPFRKNGFEYEIENVTFCIKNRLKESEIVSHKHSLEVAEILDEILKQIRKQIE
jgi:dihydrodiol dehydrogenase / D-xylose 1-dehydrogenase (NADP)